MLTLPAIPPLPAVDSQRPCENPHFHFYRDPLDSSGYLLVCPITKVAEALLLALYQSPVVSLSFEATANFLDEVSMEGEN